MSFAKGSLSFCEKNLRITKIQAGKLYMANQERAGRRVEAGYGTTGNSPHFFQKIRLMQKITLDYSVFGGMGKIVLLLALSLFCGCDSSTPLPEKNQHGVASPVLSPDNRNMVFSLCDIPGRCDIAFYEIATKRLTRINPTGQDCGAPFFSSDGQMLTFASGVGDDRNIFVMNTDGSNLRQLTHTVNDTTRQGKLPHVVHINAQPSFSPDGKRILFKRSGIRRQRSMGGEMVSHWDVHEVEIATGRERRLTNFSFYMMSRPFFLPDGRRIIYSGRGPKGDNLPAEMNAKDGNEIMIMEPGNPYPHRAFEHNGTATQPTISGGGEIAFVSRINELNGLEGSQFYYDLFLRKEGKTTRLTTEGFARIVDPVMSFDGSLVVFLASKTRDEGAALWLVKSDGTILLAKDRPWNNEQ
jgi:Tol biopolymer transport system component